MVKESTQDVPKSWLPLIQWHLIYHYDKQKHFVEAIKDFWEIVFVAGNGSGKSHMLYWNLNMLALGAHPYQFAPAPLKIKILMNDFEHGYGKIFTETNLYQQFLPPFWQIWNTEKDRTERLFDITREDEAKEYLHSRENEAFELRELPETTLEPMLREDPHYMVSQWPSRDDKTLKFANGSEYFFQTSEQKKKQHSGTNFDILACDEEPKWNIYDESKRGLRTAKGGGRIFHAFTPPFDDEDKNRGPSWTKFDLIDTFEKGDDPDIMVIRASMHDNPAITEDFIRKFSKGKTEEQIRIQVYGDYPTWGEMVHPDYQDHMWDPVTKTGHLLPYSIEIPWNDPDIMFEMAVDWHPSKPAGVIWTFEYLRGPNKGDVVVFDEISPEEGKGMTISDISKAMREHEGWQRVRIRRWGDPKMQDKNNALISGFSAWQEFRHCGINLTEANNRNPGTGVAIVNDFLRGKGKTNPNHPRLFIRETCRTLRHHMKNHYWKKLEDGTGKPDPKFSDYCINVRYILQPKSSRIQKNIEGGMRKWPITSYGGRSSGTNARTLHRYMRRG